MFPAECSCACVCVRVRERVPVCTQQAVGWGGHAPHWKCSVYEAGRAASREVGSGRAGAGGRGEACSPAAQASVEAGLLLSPGSRADRPHRVGPRAGFMGLATTYGPRGRGAAGGPGRDGGWGLRTSRAGSYPCGCLGVSEEGGSRGARQAGWDLPSSSICPFAGETPPHGWTDGRCGWEGPSAAGRGARSLGGWETRWPVSAGHGALSYIQVLTWSGRGAQGRDARQTHRAGK